MFGEEQQHQSLKDTDIIRFVVVMCQLRGLKMILCLLICILGKGGPPLLVTNSTFTVDTAVSRNTDPIQWW